MNLPMWYFVYQVTNNVTGQWILSVHQSTDIYYGSPDATDHTLPCVPHFDRSVAQYGLHNFSMRVLECDLDPKFIEKRFRTYLQDHVENPLCWNFEALRRLPPEKRTQEKIEAFLGTDTQAKGRALNPGMSEEKRAKLSAELKGIPLSAEHAAKIKASKQNRTWITDGVKTKFHDKNLPIPEGWRVGHPPRQSSKPKRIWITDGKNNKLHNPDDQVPEGWKIGRWQWPDV